MLYRTNAVYIPMPFAIIFQLLQISQWQREFTLGVSEVKGAKVISYVQERPQHFKPQC